MKKRTKKIKITGFIIILMMFVFSFTEAPGVVNAATAAPAVPTAVKAVSSSYNSINVSWNGVTGASGYAVYRATSSTGTYTLIQMTTAKNYNSTGLITGRTYYYKVRAYKIVGSSKVYSNFSVVANSKPVPSAPTSARAASTSYNSIIVSWNAVTGASGYAVYRATSSTGTYTLIRMTTARYYINTGLATGITYYYKVKAYRVVGSSKVYSNFSSMVNSKPVPAAPTSVKAALLTYNTINVSWSGVTGASGYEVYMAAAGTGTYNLIAQTTAYGYKNTGLATNSTYNYKVRAYRIVGSTKVYSNFSAFVSGITPVVHVTSVSLNKNTDTLTLGDTDTLTASIAPAYATYKSATWTSSDNSVATVDNAGNVTSIGPGTATITVTTTDGSKTANCTVTVNNADISGIDVSKWQGTIDWAAVKSDGIQFAMIRSSYGDGTSNYINNGVDQMFEANYEGAKANGIAVGAYHYSYATTVAQAEVEANFFISQLQGKQFEYPVCVDLEDQSQSTIDQETLTDIALTYLNMLKQAGYYPIIYSNKRWFTSVLDDTRLTSYDHWLAQWSSSITYTGKVGIWQYTSSGTENGISGNVDMDTSFVDYASRIKSLHLNGF